MQFEQVAPVYPDWQEEQSFPVKPVEHSRHEVASEHLMQAGEMVEQARQAPLSQYWPIGQL
jgi:hypothetical protein